MTAKNEWSTLEAIQQISPDWKITKLSDFSTGKRNSFTNGPFGSDLLSSELTESGIPIVYIRDIKEGRYQRKSTVCVTQEKADSLIACKTSYGDIIFSKVGAPPCEAAVYTDKIDAIITQDVIRIKTKDILHSYFLSYLINSDIGRRQVKRIKIVGTRERVSLTDFKKLNLPTPAFPEQRKIAQIFSTWDKAISTTESLIVNSQQQKKSLMQQLLTGKKRFSEFNNGSSFKKTKYGLIPNDWKNVKVSDIASQYSNKNKEDESYPVLSCSKLLGFIDSLKYFNKKIYSDDLTGYKIIPHGYFGFPSNHIEEGSIDCQNLYKIGLVSPIYTIFKPNNLLVDNKFLISILKTDHYRQIFSASTNASVDRRGSLKWKEFSLIKIALPSLPEQQKIASTLTTSDQEIDTLQQKLNHLKQEKKALMQQLLTGKRRVTV